MKLAYELNARIQRRRVQTCIHPCSIPLGWECKEAYNIRTASMLTTEGSMSSLLRGMRRVMVMVLIIANLATVALAEAASSVQDSQPSFPIRAAFYYPWFPEAWKQQGFDPFTNYNPSPGFYDGGSQSVIKQQ